MEDNRETITIELDHDVLFALCMMAHERDITLNQLMEDILRAEMDRVEAEKGQ